MTTQRGIGILYSIFAAQVYLMAIAGRSIEGRPIFIPLDLITLACVLIFFISIFIECNAFKIIQVILILIVTVGELVQKEYFLSLALFTNIFFILYSYGLYAKYIKIKIASSIIIVYVIYLSMTFVGAQTITYSINWLTFMIVHITSIWFIFKTTVDKAKKFDESKEMQFNHKIDMMTDELHKTQGKLSEAVDSGLELLAMVKEMKNGKR